MTNKEKAKLISEQFHCDDVAYDAAEQMAEWKDQQMIEKACEWLENNMHDYFDGNSEFAVAIDFITCDKFVEKFKKAMEE